MIFSSYKKERAVDVLANFDQQRPDLLPNQGDQKKEVYLSDFSLLVNINYLLKQPIFRTAEDILKNYYRPINVCFESGKLHYFFLFTELLIIFTFLNY